MLSIILTSYKEPGSVGKAIKSLLDMDYSGYRGEVQFIQVSPDKATLEAGQQAFSKFKNVKKMHFLQIQDPQKGKPHALNLALKEAIGKFIVFTDGDVHFERGALGKLVAKFDEDEKIGAVSGRPVSADPINKMMGYYGHLFADANHYRRMIDLKNTNLEHGKLFVRKHKFFPLSGYIMAVRKQLMNFELPEDTLVDDAYISYRVFNDGYKIAYEPEAVASIKYPKTLSDYFRQKKRSTGGYIQLWKYGVVSEDTKVRDLSQELELIWFPFKYAKNFKQFLWSSLLIPIRIWLWLQILFEQRILKKDFSKTWVRVESTK